MGRVFLIVLDSLGIGGAKDAAKFGDEGSNTLGSIACSEHFFVPNMTVLGLFNIDGVLGHGINVIGNYARLREKSAGKDTVVGHWELAGLISKKPLPTYPDGFPAEVIEKFERATGKKVICNKPYSGTEVIKDYGKEHVKTGALIVYTSADSVFQIAAHEDVVPIEELYSYSETARKLLTGKHGVGRVIARPFVGEYPNYTRTANRHDYALPPPTDTMLDILQKNGLDTIAIGKINDIFAGKGVSEFQRTTSNLDGMNKTFELLERDFCGLCFVNLVDFDAKFGHRNNVDGYAEAVTEFDNWLGHFLVKLRCDDVVILTADHGCDPATESTDHSREDVFMLAYGQRLLRGVNLKTRTTFADVSATILDLFGIENTLSGKSFYKEINNVYRTDSESV
jgi:phosphopentomutase